MLLVAQKKTFQFCTISNFPFPLVANLKHILQSQHVRPLALLLFFDEYSSPRPRQVLQLLEAMNLKQYSEKFTEEQIDGELLVECDAEVLESDLGVTRKLHRNRLIKVITGRHSAESIIKGEDPYVQLVH